MKTDYLNNWVPRYGGDPPRRLKTWKHGHVDELIQAEKLTHEKAVDLISISRHNSLTH